LPQKKSKKKSHKRDDSDDSDASDSSDGSEAARVANRERERERDAAWDVADRDREALPLEHAPRGGYADGSSASSASGRMTLQLSDAAYKLTGRAKPAPPPPTAAQLAASEREGPLKCFRCGRDGHSRNKCKEKYHKSGNRLMSGGHFH
jgi:hypothetical protein